MFRLKPRDPDHGTSTPPPTQMQGHQPAAPETDLGHLAVAQLAGDGSSTGQGFKSSAKVRRAIELHAMAITRAHYEVMGWELTDVSGTKPYDFTATKGGHVKRLEVKGTTSAGQEVLLTPNEVAHARTYPDTALVICHSIELQTPSDDPTTTGGHLEIYDPWIIDEGHLAPIGYAYTVPGQTP